MKTAILAALAAVSFLLTACGGDSHFQSGKEFDATQVSAFKNGVTTAEEVQAKLGAPLTTMKEGPQETWTYQFSDYQSKTSKAQANAQAKSFAVGMIPFVGSALAFSTMPDIIAAKPDSTSTWKTLTFQFIGGILRSCTLMASSGSNEQQQIERSSCS